MDANITYKIILYAVAKSAGGGDVTPEEFNTVLMPTAQSSYLDYLLGEYTKQQVGRPIPVVAFGQNQKLRSSLASLIYQTILNPNTITGIAAYPSDIEIVDAMWSVYGFYNIRFTEQDRLQGYYQSTIDPITENPVYLIRHEGFQFYPETIGQARMSYVRTPPPIVWGYDEDSNGLPVYNPAKSQQPVWAEMDMLNIIVRALRLVGVNLQLAAVQQYANEIKERGA